MESENLIVYNSMKKIIDIIDEDEKEQFIWDFARYIDEDFCEELLWSEEQISRMLKNNEFDYLFFKKVPKNKKEVYKYFVGLANVKDKEHLSSLCSRGYGRKIFNWIDKKYNYPDWKIEALPEAVMFWRKMGFKFFDENPKHGEFLEKLWKKHGYEIIKWLTGDVDVDSYKGNEMYYEAKDFINFVLKYKDISEIYHMERKKTKKLSTIEKYLITFL